MKTALAANSGTTIQRHHDSIVGVNNTGTDRMIKERVFELKRNNVSCCFGLFLLLLFPVVAKCDLVLDLTTPSANSNRLNLNVSGSFFVDGSPSAANRPGNYNAIRLSSIYGGSFFVDRNPTGAISSFGVYNLSINGAGGVNDFINNDVLKTLPPVFSTPETDVNPTTGYYFAFFENNSNSRINLFSTEVLDMGEHVINDSFSVEGFDYSILNPGTYTWGGVGGDIGDGITLNIIAPPSPTTTPEPSTPEPSTPESKPDLTKIITAISVDQLFNSALPMNQAAGQIGSGMQQTGVQGFNNRLFRSRGRVNSGGSTGTGGRQVNASRHLSQYQLFRKKHEINLDTERADVPEKADREADITEVAEMLKLSNRSYRFSTEEQTGALLNPDVVAAGDQWIVFASGNFANQRIDAEGTTPGVVTNAQGSTIGFEYALNDTIALGGGWSHLWSDNQFSGGSGSADFEGDAVVGYASYFKNNLWGDILYSYGNYEADIRRNTGLGTVVNGSPDQTSHLASLNLGYNIPKGEKVTHGPTFTMDYSQGQLDAYTETGDPLANVAFLAQDFESLITRLGWQVTWDCDTYIGKMMPQARIGYARENLDQDQTVSGVIVNGPVVVNGTSTNTSQAGEGWMEFGFGVSVQPMDQFTIFVDYSNQLFRQNSEAHFGSVSARYAF